MYNLIFKTGFLVSMFLLLVIVKIVWVIADEYKEEE